MKITNFMPNIPTLPNLSNVPIPKNIQTPMPGTTESMSTFETMKQASQIIIDVATFIKDLFINPVNIFDRCIDLLQGVIEPTALIILAVIIILKMIGFEKIEKWGILTLIIYAVIMVL